MITTESNLPHLADNTQTVDNFARDILSENQLAALLKISTRTLRRWHVLRLGPPRFKIGQVILYRAAAVESWLTRNESEAVHR